MSAFTFFALTYLPYCICLHIYRLLIKVIKVDNRVFLALTFITALIGSILIGDWQAIGHDDPCSSADMHLSTFTNKSGLADTELGMLSPASGLGIAEELLPQEQTDLNLTLQQHYVDRCQAMSSSSHQCFWNPMSRVTGDFCSTCRPGCLSEQRSLNFYQYCLGILLFSFATPLGYVFNSAIASDLTPMKSQVVAFSI